MPALIHLNGPPGIGKSTLAALYVDRHAGALNLDIDSLLRLVGGWRDPDTDAHLLLRPVARAMAATHLAAGHDVVLPQYLARIEEIEAFEAVAADAGARFVEIVLLAGKDEAIARFERREDDSEWAVHHRRHVADQGGAVFLDAMYERLADVVALRTSAKVVHSEPGAVEQTYAELVAAISDDA